MSMLTDGLQNAYLEVGPRIRSIRRSRRLSLRELGEATSTSASFLSQLERGESGATLATLMRICDALGVGISDLFSPSGHPVGRLTRNSDRPSIEVEHGYTKFLLSMKPLQNIEAYVGEFVPGANTGKTLYTHGDAQELVWVLSGQAVVTVGDVTYELARGDSLEYRTSTPHGLVNTGTQVAKVLWIVSPPTPGGSQTTEATG